MNRAATFKSFLDGPLLSCQLEGWAPATFFCKLPCGSRDIIASSRSYSEYVSLSGSCVYGHVCMRMRTPA